MKRSLLWLIAIPSLSFARFAGVGDSAPASPLDDSVLSDSSPAKTPVALEAGSPTSLRQKFGRYLLESGQRWDFGLEAGIHSLHIEGKTFFAPAVGLRISPFSSPWSVELGAFTPHDVPGDFRTASQAGDNAAYAARVKSLYEVHLTSNYSLLPAGRQGRMTWVVPELGFGVSMMHIINQIESDTNTSYQFMGQTFFFQIHNAYETSPSSPVVTPKPLIIKELGSKIGTTCVVQVPGFACAVALGFPSDPR